jgi:hypothetical protein
MGWAGLPDDKICATCGGPLAPDDRGTSHESCFASRPGRALCRMCSRVIRGGFDAAAYINLPDERCVGPLHHECIDGYRMLRGMRGAL